jgi:hypothetical protein
MGRAVLKRVANYVYNELSKVRVFLQGRIGFKIGNFLSTRPHRDKTDCLELVCSFFSHYLSN